MKTFNIFKMHLLKSFGTIQFWVPFIIAFGAIHTATVPLSDISMYFNSPVNVFTATFLLSDKITTFLIFLGIYILFCELPFCDNNQTFLLIRGGKRAWIFGQILYIIAVCIMYFAFVFMSYCLILSSNIDFSIDCWGKIVNTIASTNISDTFGLRISMPQNVLSAFKPIDAFMTSFLLAILISSTLGIIILSFNLIVKKNSGLIISGFFIFLYLFISYVNAISEIMFYFSPVGWCSLILIDKNGSSPLPTVEYAVTVLGIVIVFLISTLFVYSSKKVKFNFDLKNE